MKKLIKRLAIGFVVICVLGALASFATSGGSSEKTATDEVTINQPEKAQAKKKEPVEKVTREKFDTIKQGDALTGNGGDSKEKVLKLLGEPGGTTESMSGNTKMENYTWTTKDFQIVGITFINGKVSGKTWMQ